MLRPLGAHGNLPAVLDMSFTTHPTTACRTKIAFYWKWHKFCAMFDSIVFFICHQFLVFALLCGAGALMPSFFSRWFTRHHVLIYPLFLATQQVQQTRGGESDQLEFVTE